MSINAVTHLNFNGDARAALEFYHSVFGGDLTIATYADFGAPQEMPDATRVVWGQVQAPDGFGVMAYDTPSVGGIAPGPSQTRREHSMTMTDSSFFVSLRGDDPDQIKRLWEGLAADATVIEALAPAQWAPLFGMLTDKFGVTWVIDVAPPYAG